MVPASMTQRQRTAAVLDLLDRSFAAHRAGDQTRFEALLNEAGEVDAQVVLAVRGGIIIGEIPNPETHPRQWADYVGTAQEHAYEPD